MGFIVKVGAIQVFIDSVIKKCLTGCWQKLEIIMSQNQQWFTDLLPGHSDGHSSKVDAYF